MTKIFRSECNKGGISKIESVKPYSANEVKRVNTWYKSYYSFSYIRKMFFPKLEYVSDERTNLDKICTREVCGINSDYEEICVYP